MYASVSASMVCAVLISAARHYRCMTMLHAHLLHHFAEVASVLDPRLTPVFGALGSRGCFGVEQACPDEESDKVGFLQAIVAPFPVQLYSGRRHDIILWTVAMPKVNLR